MDVSETYILTVTAISDRFWASSRGNSAPAVFKGLRNRGTLTGAH
jgi:hypothetical protein